MSEFKVECVRIGDIEKHPNADSLSITNVHGGYPCIFKTGDFQTGDLAVYVPVDALVPVAREEFRFLDGGKGRAFERIKARKLRGTFSMGLLVKAPEGARDGDDMQSALGIDKWLPESEREPAQPNRVKRKGSWLGYVWLRIRQLLGLAPPKPPSVPVYDIEGIRKHSGILREGEEVVIREKIHGCVSAMTSIWMADGSRKKVAKVVVGDEVMGVDENGCAVATRVTNTFRNGHTNEWLRVEVSASHAGRGNAIRVLTVTGNHKFWCVNRGCYIRADELSTDDTVSILRTDQELTPVQKSVLIGKMLGDGSLSISSSGSGSASVSINQSSADSGYVDWTMKAITGLSGRSVRCQKSGYGTDMVATGTVFRREIYDLFKDWVSSGKKSIPDCVEFQLDPISMAFWYMDDGSLGHHDDQEDRANFATCGFTERDVMVLVRGMARYGISAEVYDSRGPRIRLNADNAEKFFLLVAPYIPRCMQRKLPERYRGHDGWIPSEKQYKPMTVDATINSITRVSPSITGRYDLETETHNYFASGILVHNCNSRYVHTGKRLFIGSRTIMGKVGPSVWTTVAQRYELEAKLKQHPGVVLFGEVYGSVQDLKYGVPPSEEVRFVAFDALWPNKDGTRRWLDNDDLERFCASLSIPMAPVLYRGPWKPELVSLAEGKTTMPGASHVREGFVVRPVVERHDPRFGRVQLKLAGEGYLTRKEQS